MATINWARTFRRADKYANLPTHSCKRNLSYGRISRWLRHLTGQRSTFAGRAALAAKFAESEQLFHVSLSLDQPTRTAFGKQTQRFRLEIKSSQ